MHIEIDIIGWLKEHSPHLFKDSCNVRVLHVASSEEPLAYYFVLFDNDLIKPQSYLRGISFIDLMKKVLRNKDATREIELEYQGFIKDLDDYKPDGMRVLDQLLLNPYEQAEESDTRSMYAYKDYIKNVFYDFWHDPSLIGRKDVVNVGDTNFTPKKSLESLLESNGFSKEEISRLHIVRCVRHPVGDKIYYVGS